MKSQLAVNMLDRRLALVGLVVVLLTGFGLLTLELVAYARLKASGASGCGDFIVAVNGAADGDTVVQMNTPAKDTSGAVIDKALWILGGWLPSPTGCDVPNQEFESIADMIAAGFVFDPSTRAELFHAGDPVLTVDIDYSRVVTVENMFLTQNGTTVAQGAGINARVSSFAELWLDNTAIQVSQTATGGMGGGMYLELEEGTRAIIRDGDFSSNKAGSGGGLEIHVADKGQVVIDSTLFRNNDSWTGNGGGGRIVFAGSGTLTVKDSHFSENTAGSQGYAQGGALSIESLGNGPVVVCDQGNTFTDNAPEASGFHTSGNGVTFGCPQAFFPVVLNNAQGLQARITGVTVSGNSYAIAFKTYGFTPQVPGIHVHFFFDTVPSTQAGVPGAGPWKLYGGSSPFTGYALSDRPAGASKMCILVANPDHGVQPGTGNCVDLPT